MKVLIVNTCSTLNRGDAAIVLGQIHLLRESFPGVQIALTSKTPALDRPFYAHLGIEVLPPLLPALSVYRGARQRLVGSAQDLLNWRDKKRLIREMQRCDLVLSCGGGYFYSYRKALPGTTFWQNVIHARLATTFDKPLVFMPQSIGPFTSSLARRGVKSLLEKRQVLRVFAREKISCTLLEHLLGAGHQSKIALCPDMALYLERQALLDRSQDEGLDLPQPVLVVNLREWTFPQAKDPASGRSKRTEYLEALASVARFFVQRYGGSVVAVPQALGPDPSEDDRAICREFCRRAQERVPAGKTVQYHEPGTNSLDSFVALLSQAAVLLGTRLHACILALLVGVPVVSVGYQHKSQGTLDLLGLGHFNTSIDEVSSSQLVALVEEVMANRQEIREENERRLVEIRAWIGGEVGGLLRSAAQNSRPATRDRPSYRRDGGTI